MATKKTTRRTARAEPTHQLAVAMIGPKGEVEFIPSMDVRFPTLATALASAGHLVPLGIGDNPFRGTGIPSVGPYQRLLGGSPNLRQLLLPREGNFDDIIDRIDDYRKKQSWINRGLILRAAFNASEISIQAPGQPKQTTWMHDLLRQLKFFSFAREWFWQLRAYGQVVTLWKTGPDGKKPISIECADLRAHQPRGPGPTPRIVVLAGKLEPVRKLIQEARGSALPQAQRARAQLAAYPKPIVDAVRGTKKDAEVAAEELAPYGYHLLYTAFDRRHHEDWGFPGMYTIFGDIEMVEMARAVDINALHHYKAAILLVRLGPQDPSGTDIPVMATQPQLKALEAKLMEQARNRLPTLVARGDLKIDFITPPVEVFTAEKYKMAIANIFDWMGIPKSAWPGQDLTGSFASAQVTLKFLQQESKDERDLFRETFESWFYERAQASNAFEGARYPIISFDPNALIEPRLVLDKAKHMWTMGVSEATVLDALDLDPDVEANRLKEYADTLKKAKGQFIPRAAQAAQGGRPETVNQPTPERETAPQPRPSTSE